MGSYLLTLARVRVNHSYLRASNKTLSAQTNQRDRYSQRETMNTTFDETVQAELSGEMSIDGSLLDKESPPAFVTHRKCISRLDQEGEVSIRDEMQSFQNSIMTMMETWFAKQDEKFTRFLQDFDDVKRTIEFISKNYEDLNKKTQDIDRRVVFLEQKLDETQNCRQQVGALEAKIDTLEQQARCCNVEICNLPEKKGENLNTILQDIASAVKQPIAQHDVISIHRVPQGTPNSSRPKNVVVKFCNRLTRDNFITAARRTKGLTTADLNVAGRPQKVYINEHLTLRNKILFREVRDTAKKYQFAYVWIKHGTILVRKNDTSSVFAIRTKEDLSKIK